MFNPLILPDQHCNQKAEEMDVHAILQVCKLVQALQGGQRVANLAKSAARTSLCELLACTATLEEHPMCRSTVASVANI